jgi:nucleotide-binding universal stress UspA family protein
MFDRIVLALDDSPAGEVATVFATALAVRAGATAHVVHVNERLVGGRGVTLRTRDEATELVSSALRYMADHDVQADGSVRVASYRGVAAAIVDTARDREGGAIVLGSHRNRRLGRLFSAQVRERTTRQTTLPVLVAPSPLKVTGLAPDGSGPSSWEGRIDHILDSFLH